jgi:magnesium chelatase family protein
MGLASLLSRGQAGLEAYQVTVEVHLAPGLPGFAVTGLPAAAVRESKDRVRAALNTSGYKVPVSRITVHLGPADIPKQGGRFDLPIALGVIVAELQPGWPTANLEFLGELSLNGDVRPITGALPAVLAAQKAGHALVLPAANAAEAALVRDAEVYTALHLNDVVQHLKGEFRLPRVLPRTEIGAANTAPDLADVRGQAFAKRALTVAAGVPDHVSRLHLLHHDPRFHFVGRYFQHRLVLIGIERQSLSGNAGDPMLGEYLVQLTLGRLDAGDQAL